MFKLKPSKNLKIDTLIGANTRIDGDIVFAGSLHLDGRINGDVRGDMQDEAVLWVNEQGGIDGTVSVSNIVLNGFVNGDIEAAGRVELGENARVAGNVTYALIESAVGAQITGQLIHREVAADRTGATVGSETGAGGEAAATE